ncbi:MAG: anhydro-N-acetylmuramic acid kinase [Bacteroidota bacterium]
MKKYRVVGVMSGTSLDGMDLAFCEFSKQKNGWQFKLHEAITYNYTDNWKSRLSQVYRGTARDLAETHKDFGLLTGEILKVFIQKHNLKPDFVASHGHTVFHNPDSFYSVQIGSGAHIASRVGLPVISDFRAADVAKGGQGAPLVPVGDKYLFGQYDACLNLGGFANISFDDAEGFRRAFDISPCNMALNDVAARENLSMDQDGLKSRKGNIDMALLEQLNALDFYWKTDYKSLGKEWYDDHFRPLIAQSKLPVNDLLATVSEHIAFQVAKVMSNHPKRKILITGGGAHNEYLTERIKASLTEDIILPEKNIIDFKEALIFAFLGVLRMQGEINVLKTVTGATANSCAGTIHLP